MNEARLAISLDDLTIGYTRRAEAPVIDGLTFGVRERELFVITGPTGAGKSTLLKILSVESIAKGPRILGGDAVVLGRDVLFLPARARYRLQANIGYLSQNGAMELSPQFTVAENIVMPITSRDKHWDKADLSRRVFELLDELELSRSHAAKYPHELSSGQRQRVALAKSFVFEPTLWIADDPTRGVDVIARKAVIEFIRRKKALGNITMVIATADATILQTLADRIAVIDEGMLAEIGFANQLLENPQSLYLQDYLQLHQ